MQCMCRMHWRACRRGVFVGCACTSACVCMHVCPGHMSACAGRMSACMHAGHAPVCRVHAPEGQKMHVWVGAWGCAGHACAWACRTCTCARECKGCKVCLCLCAPSDTSRGVCGRSRIPRVGVQAGGCRGVGFVPAAAVPGEEAAPAPSTTCRWPGRLPWDSSLINCWEGKGKQSLLHFPPEKASLPRGARGGGQHPAQPQSLRPEQ